MKLVTNIVLGLLVLVGVAVGGSLLFLPAQVTQQQTVTIERPSSTVFALLASMPATYKVNDTLSQKVKGDVTTAANGVTSELTTADGRKMTGKWTIAPQGAATQVQLSLTEELGMNPIARFQGQSGAQLAPVLKAALDKLTEEANGVPNFDFSSLQYVVWDTKPRRFIYVKASTAQDAERIKDGIRQSIALARTALASNGLTADGMPIAVETAWEEGKYSFQAGLPYTGPQPLNLIGVEEGETPSGPAIKVTYEGPEDDIIPVYDQMEALMKATRLERGQSMEVFQDDPTQAGGSKKRDIYYFIRSGDAPNVTKFAPPGTGKAALPSMDPTAAPAGATPPATPAIPAEATPATPTAPAPAETPKK